MSFVIDNNYDRYDYTQNTEAAATAQEQEKEEVSVFQEFSEGLGQLADGFKEIANVFGGTLEDLKNAYNTYIQAQQDGFEEDSDKKDDVNLFKDGVTTNSEVKPK